MIIEGKMLIKFTYVSGWEGVGMLEGKDKIKNCLQLEIWKKIESYSAETDTVLGRNNQLVGQTD